MFAIFRRMGAESRNPEDIYFTMLIQGVSARLFVLRSSACVTGAIISSGSTFLPASGTLYVGVTGFFDRRIHQHKYDTIEDFTRKYQVHRLVYYESYQDALAGPCRELGAGKSGFRDSPSQKLPESASRNTHPRDFSTPRPSARKRGTSLRRCARNDKWVG